MALRNPGRWFVMTFLLLKVSGVILLEQDISDRRPAYRAYIQRTLSDCRWGRDARRRQRGVI
jgi:steroid 5-alpha reductase family enzyme